MSKRVLFFTRDVFVSMLFLLALSCVHKSKPDPKTITDKNNLSVLFGKKIELLPNLPIYDPLLDSITRQNTKIGSKNKIVTRIDGKCLSCTKELLDWKDFMDTLDITNFDVRIYLNIKDFELIRHYLERWRFEYPIVLDRDNRFELVNEIPRESEFQTFLLNEKNQIILVGNPLKNSELKQLYLKTMDTISFSRRAMSK